MSTKRRGVVAPLLLMALIALLTAIPTFGQERESYDAHFYVLMASNDASKRSDLPGPVDSAIRQFRESLPYRNYRLITTLVGRFRDRVPLELSGVTPPNLIGPSNANRPVFYSFTLMPRAEPSAEPTRSINLDSVRFSIQLPVIEGMARTDPNTPPTPILSYHSMEVKTGLSIREGIPAVVGSLTTGQLDEQLVLVLHVTKSP
jgi:hypothetical protein